MATREEKKERDTRERLRDESLRKQRHDKSLRQRIFSEGLAALDGPMAPERQGRS